MSGVATRRLSPSPRPRRPGRVLSVVLGCLAVVLFGTCARAIVGSDRTGNGSSASSSTVVETTTGSRTADSTIEPQPPVSFLDDYVDPDGRVVRHDQGGDTVSEGQAYGMLVAAGTGDAERFAAIWQWTEDHLLLPNGLLAWHWENGSVTDPSPAADADLDAAHALLLAADKFAVPAYRDDALALGRAIVAEETVTAASSPVLVAGPWARSPKPIVNPSYTSVVAYSLLAEASGDPIWTAMATSGVEQLGQVTENGSQLPPDWAQIDADGSVSPDISPGGRAISYGYDAFRVLPRAAGSCDPAARSLAAALADPTAEAAATSGAFFELDGDTADAGSNPALLVAAAAAAAAAGEDDASAQLMGRAAAALDETPSYYLSAWLALGQLFLEGTPLGGCPAGG